MDLISSKTATRKKILPTELCDVIIMLETCGEGKRYYMMYIEDLKLVLTTSPFIPSPKKHKDSVMEYFWKTKRLNLVRYVPTRTGRTSKIMIRYSELLDLIDKAGYYGR